jgi:hypothetical protein
MLCENLRAMTTSHIERIRKMKRLALFLTVCGIASYASAAVPVTTGLQLQLEADSLGLNNGDTVSTWTDLSGGNRTAYTAGSPTYVANGLNGHAYVSIKGSLSADGFSWTGNNYDYFNLDNPVVGVQTIAMVLRRTSNNYYGTSNGHGISMFGGTSEGSWVSAPYAGDNRWGTAFAGNNADPAVLYGNVYINGGSGNEADYTAVLDQFQVLYFTIQQNWGVNLRMDQIATDSEWNPYVWGMDLAELLVYDTALSSADQASVTSYLTGKYFAVTLSIAKSGNQAVLTWPTGTLQQASSVTGTYTDVVGATSPYTNVISGEQFFRLKVQ